MITFFSKCKKIKTFCRMLGIVILSVFALSSCSKLGEIFSNKLEKTFNEIVFLIVSSVGELDTNFNGIWVRSDYDEQWEFSKGKVEKMFEDIYTLKGTYRTKNDTIYIKYTHIHTDILSELASRYIGGRMVRPEWIPMNEANKILKELQKRMPMDEDFYTFLRSLQMVTLSMRYLFDGDMLVLSSDDDENKITFIRKK